MGRAALLALGLWLLGAGLAHAQTLPGNGLPEGTFASTLEGCTKLEKKTPAELGEGLDFQVLSKKGLAAYEQICDFVNVFAHDAKSWVATAFCDEAGYTYPDLFSIKQKEEGRLNVTRITDLTQQGASDSDSDESASPAQPDVAGNAPGADSTGDQGPSTDEQTASESYSTFVKCQDVKP
ncbi:MAG: hypothetical protein WA441_03530 [Methyloceanibacter sp.]|jgi:hypothetical protein